MTVVVSFIKPRSVTGGVNAPGIGKVRIRENLTVGSSTTATAEAGECVVIGNAETSMIAAAFGTTPDAATTTATSTSSAGFPIGAGQTSVTLVPKPGDKINVKAVS